MKICGLLVGGGEIMVEEGGRSGGMLGILWGFGKWRRIVWCLI